MYSTCVNALFDSLLKRGLNIPWFPIGPRCNGRVGQKMSCKFFSISTYDYIQNTCLHYNDELELVLKEICPRGNNKVIIYFLIS